MKASELQREAMIAESKDASQANENDEPPEGLSISKPVIFSPRQEMVISDRSRNFLQRFFPDASLKDWNSWQWQLKNSFSRLPDLARVVSLDENEIRPQPGYYDSLPLRITPYYASLLDPENSGQPLRRSMVPVLDEYVLSPGEASDPLGEGGHSPVPNLVHRYPDRVLLLSTGFCAAYCRYCTRSHLVAKDKCHIGKKAWAPALDYIRAHPQVRDVIISGGDPLTMPDTHIEYLLGALRAIDHVEMIRIGSKVPVVLPQRITRNLAGILKKYHPVYMSLHFIHPDEITPEVAQACTRLANAGLPLGSQTVLLKGINDDAEVMRRLMQGLLKIRVRPYYLYQCDPIPGSEHFRTSVDKGLEIIESLRGHTSGYAVPQFVIDAPGGGGKIPLLPEYFKGKKNGKVTLRNYEDRLFYYPDEK
jgi:lysine 2,3-aminomutase